MKTGKLKYTVEHEASRGGIIVEIDHDFKTKCRDDVYLPGVCSPLVGYLKMDLLIKEMVEFWSDYKTRLIQNSGNYQDTFLKMLCEQCLRIQLENNCTTDKVVEMYQGLEGWCKIDGSAGIKLLHVEPMELKSQDAYKITLLQTSKTARNEKL